jgi:hypothetical protein
MLLVPSCRIDYPTGPSDGLDPSQIELVACDPDVDANCEGGNHYEFNCDSHYIECVDLDGDGVANDEEVHCVRGDVENIFYIFRGDEGLCLSND